MAETAPRVAGIYRKLVKVMAQIKRIPKNGTNTKFNYKFATESDVSDTLRDILVEQGVAFTASIDGECTKEAQTTASGGTMYYSRVPLLLQFIDADDGTCVMSRWIGEGMDTQDKSFYKAYTGGIKYGLLKMFLIPTGDEPDADNHDDHRPPQRQSAAQQRPPVAPAPTDKVVAAVQQALGGEVQADKPSEMSDEAKAALKAIAVNLQQRGIVLKDDHTDAWHRYLKGRYGVDSQKDLTESQLTECVKLAKGTKAALYKALHDAGVSMGGDAA